jgi:hypothetical protein
MLTKTALRDMKKELKDRLIDISVEAQGIEKQLAALDVLISPLETPKKLMPNGSNRYKTKRSVRKGFINGTRTQLGVIRKTPYEALAVPLALIKIWDEIDPTKTYTARDLGTLLIERGMKSNSPTPVVSVAASVTSAISKNWRVRDYYKQAGKDTNGVKLYQRRKFVSLESAK